MKKYVSLLLFFAWAVRSSYCQTPSANVTYSFYCPPCGNGACDTIAYDQPGICPICHMELIRRPRKERGGSATSNDHLAGHWKGMARTADQQLSISLDISTGSNPSVLFSAEEIAAMNVKAVGFKATDKNLHFELYGDDGAMVFSGEINKDKISGQFTTVDRSAAVKDRTGFFEMERAILPAVNYSVRDVIFHNGEIQLAGSLYLPAGPGPFPAMVCNHSSGDQQRYDGAFMADFLANRGISVLIYDKRGDGLSTGDWRTASFEELADDCIAGIHFLQTIPSINPKAIGIFGHSQGATISPIIVARCPDIAFNIAAAGFAVSPSKQDVFRVTNILRHKAHFNKAVTDSALRFYKIWLEVARTGKGWDDMQKENQRVRSAGWYSWVQPPDSGNWAWSWYRMAGNYNFTPFWQKVKIPTLLLYGKKDEITPVEPSRRRIESALRKADNSKFQLVMFPNAIHYFAEVKKEGDLWAKTTPGYYDRIYNWIAEGF